MNKYIKEYIELRKEEIVEEERLKKFGLLEKLKLGKMEYSGDFPDDPKDSFPYYDISRNDCYRYNLGEVSEEDYAELLKYIPADNNPEVPQKKKSGWYTFALVLLSIGCLIGVIGGMVMEDIWYTIGIVIGVLIFFSQIILLCKIEYNTREV